MRGLDSLAQYIFNMPVHQPVPQDPSQPHSYLADPRYCTAIGLIRYAQRYDDDALHHANSNILSRILKKLGFK